MIWHAIPSFLLNSRLPRSDKVVICVFGVTCSNLVHSAEINVEAAPKVNQEKLPTFLFFLLSVTLVHIDYNSGGEDLKVYVSWDWTCHPPASKGHCPYTVGWSISSFDFFTPRFIALFPLVQPAPFKECSQLIRPSLTLHHSLKYFREALLVRFTAESPMEEVKKDDYIMKIKLKDISDCHLDSDLLRA